MATQNEMKNLGDIFKVRRKEMNVSLKEAENATSIRSTYLSSIEEGEMNKLISPVYAQGFVRQYAAFLGLDGDKIVKEHPHLFNKHENQEFAYGIGTLEMRGNPRAGVKWFPNLVWVGVTLAVVVIAWYFAHSLDLI